MQQSKLIALLKTFETKDFSLFEQYLLSPYFNSNAEILSLYQYIKVKIKLKTHFLEKEYVYKQVFKKRN
jgi:hypothetical protein